MRFLFLLCATVMKSSAVLTKDNTAPSFSGPQLNLLPCTSTAPSSALTFSYANNAFILTSTKACITYDPQTTNLYTDTCVPGGSPQQTFSIQPDGTFLNPSTSLCWDSQYYGNASGSVLGLYNCYSTQDWDHFSFDSTTGLISYKNASTGLCVNGGFSPPPLPTPEQLAWMDYEVSLMISYDIVTSLTEVANPQHFCIQAGGDKNFPVPPPTRFAPSNETFTDSWMLAAKAAEAKYTLLVASHCSGFMQWQSNITLPDGSPYPYTVAQSYWKGGKGDVVDDYVRSSQANGLPFGFYLTWNYNYLFNWGPSGFAKTPLQPGQINITEDEYRALMLAQMEEVWSRYPGQITEIWFDGGENNVGMNDLIKRLQPQAIAADGTQGPNIARLVGQESGYAPYPVWSTTSAAAVDGSGSPTGGVFCPAEADTPIAEDDGWFWKPNQKYRPLTELYAVYRNTVGSNSLLELGVLPDDTGAIPADQMGVLQGLGDYIRTCHSLGAAVAASNGTGSTLSFDFPPTLIDRVWLMEDLSLGELVQGFEVYVSAPGGYAHNPVLVATGSAIGHKRILYFQSGPIMAQGIKVVATTLYPGYMEANWRSVAAFPPCALG